MMGVSRLYGVTPKTGSTEIYRALSSGVGLLYVCLGVLLLLVSSAVHSNVYHVMAALIFALAIGGMKILGRVDDATLGTPWRVIIRLTDYMSLATLCLATFGPLLVLAVHGHPGWDLMVLGGILLVWWNVLHHLIADYRRLRRVAVVLVVAWLPVSVIHVPIEEAAFISAGLGLCAVVFSVWQVTASLKSVPREYRVIEPEPQPRLD